MFSLLDCQEFIGFRGGGGQLSKSFVGTCGGLSCVIKMYFS